MNGGKASIKVISGLSHGTDSVQELAYTPVWIFDVTIKPGGKITQKLPVGWNAFAYTLSGTALFGTAGKDQQTIENFHNVMFEQRGDALTVEVDPSAEEDSRFSKLSPLPSHTSNTDNATVPVAGLPLEPKVVQYGPFVLNSQDQVYQAMLDYQSHSNGFERFGNSMLH